MIGLGAPFPYAGSRALVTGASSGIGEAFARELARRGCGLVLVARSQAALERIASELSGANGVEVAAIACDLGDRDARHGLLERLAGVEVDLLVNNAGQGSHGRFVALDPEHELAMVELNCAAVVELTRAVLPGMVERGSGGVVNVASTAGFQPTPTMATYGATKAFVLSFSEAIGQETRRHGVRVVAFCPGPVATNFASAAGSRRLAGRLQRAVPPEAVVPVALEGLDKGRSVVVPGAMNRVGSFGGRHGPRRVVTAVAEQLLRTDRRG